MDLTSGQLSEGRSGVLTGRELSLLVHLVQHAGKVVAREELTVQAFGYSPRAKTRAVDKAMHGLRRKVEASPSEPEHLFTCQGSGYRFAPLPAEEIWSLDQPLVGRQGDLGRLEVALAAGVVVTVTGPPGVGKTRLVEELTHRLGGSVPALWVNLEGAQTESEVRLRVGRARGLPPAERTDAELVEEAQPRLWILDGRGPGPELAASLERWRPLAPQACWIRTGDGPLHIRDERIVMVRPLTADDAVRMFRLRAERRGRPLPDSEEIRRLVDRLDGLPLAVGLAADRLGPLGIVDLIGAVERRELDLLTWPPSQGERTLGERLEASWATLSPGERRLLALALRLDGPFGVDVLVGASGWPCAQVIRGVERLVERSWVLVDDLDGRARLRLMRTTRHFLEQRDGDSRCGEGETGRIYPALPRWSAYVSRSSSALLLQEALAELEATSPGAPSGPAIVTLVELLAPVIHTRVSRVLLRHAATTPRTDLRQEVEDQVQAVFAKLFADRGRVLRLWEEAGGLSLANWVGRFAQLRATDAVRSGLRGPWRSEPVDPSWFDDATLPHTPEDASAARELWVEARRRVLEDESEAGREMFGLFFDEERTVDDIVAQTGRTRASVLKWRSRLRLSMREELRNLMAEGRHDEA